MKYFGLLRYFLSSHTFIKIIFNFLCKLLQWKLKLKLSLILYDIRFYLGNIPGTLILHRS